MLEIRMVDRDGNRLQVMPDGVDTVRVVSMPASGGVRTLRVHASQINNMRKALEIAGAQLPDLGDAHFIDGDLVSAEEFADFPECSWIAEEAARVDAEIAGAV